jgi:hypothetical protein
LRMQNAPCVENLIRWKVPIGANPQVRLDIERKFQF